MQETGARFVPLLLPAQSWEYLLSILSLWIAPLGLLNIGNRRSTYVKSRRRCGAAGHVLLEALISLHLFSVELCLI